MKTYKKSKQPVSTYSDERTSSEEPPDKPRALVVRTAKLDTESQRLKNILACIDPDTLYSYTMAKLGNRDPKIIEALCTLLPIEDLISDLSELSSSDSEKSEKSNKSKANSTYTSSSNNDSGITTISMGSSTNTSFISNVVKQNEKSVSLISTTDFERSIEDNFFKKTESVVLTPEPATTKKILTKKKSKQKQMQHCVRCHKNFDGKSRSSAEWRCTLPHPEDMVVKIKDITGGADFKCMACNREFRILGMNFYEEGTNSMMTGFCEIDRHTTDPSKVKFRQENGAAQTCEAHGCVEFYV